MGFFFLFFLIFNIPWKARREALLLRTLCQAIVMREAGCKGDFGVKLNFGNAIAFNNILEILYPHVKVEGQWSLYFKLFCYYLSILPLSRMP